MEGTRGVTIEIGVKTAPVAVREKAPTQSGDTTVAKTENNNSKKTHDQTTDTGSEAKPSTAENKGKDKTEPDFYEEMTNKIREHVDKLGEHLDKDTKQELIESYLSDLFDTDKKKDKKDKLVDDLAEMIRLLILLVKLLWLASKPHPTGKYSGKDLGLSDAPPEGHDPNPLTKALTGKDARESWTKFKDEVEKIENVSLSELSKYVFEANSRYSVKQFKLKKSENGIKEIFGNNKREMVKQNSRFAKTRGSGRRR